VADNRRTRQIDQAVEEAVRGKKPEPKPKPSDKPIWERSGMTYEEYQEGMRRRTQESVVEKSRQAGAERQSEYRR
jgi:hypothetical protein